MLWRCFWHHKVKGEVSLVQRKMSRNSQSQKALGLTVFIHFYPFFTAGQAWGVICCRTLTRRLPCLSSLSGSSSGGAAAGVLRSIIEFSVTWIMINYQSIIQHTCVGVHFQARPVFTEERRLYGEQINNRTSFRLRFNSIKYSAIRMITFVGKLQPPCWSAWEERGSRRARAQVAHAGMRCLTWWCCMTASKIMFMLLKARAD